MEALRYERSESAFSTQEQSVCYFETVNIIELACYDRLGFAFRAQKQMEN